MDLSVIEAAGLARVSPRYMRNLIRDEKLPAKKVNGQWKIKKEDLTVLFPELQAEFNAKLSEVRASVDQTLDKVAQKHGVRGYGSVQDLRTWRQFEPVWQEIQKLSGAGADEERLIRAKRSLAAFAGMVVQGYHEWNRKVKRASYETARRRLAAGITHLLLYNAAVPERVVAVTEAVQTLERDVMVSLSGLIRTMERRR